jgi:hypothetical protein
MHGNASAHGNAPRTAKAPERTAASGRTATMKAHGNDEGARQRFFGTTTNNSARQRILGTAEALSSSSGKTLDKGCIAGDGIAVRYLPCVDAQQCLCRVNCPLCHASMVHGNEALSGSASRSATEASPPKIVISLIEMRDCTP